MVTRAIETMFVAGPNAGKFNGELLRAPRQTESRRWVTGMPDEATRRKNITNQTMAHRELGLEYMDLRLAEDSDGKVKNVVAIDDRAFGEVERAVNRAGLVVSCFESSIANWKRSLTEPLEADIV